MSIPRWTPVPIEAGFRHCARLHLECCPVYYRELAKTSPWGERHDTSDRRSSHRISKRIRRKGAFASMNGSAIPGVCSSPIPRTLPRSARRSWAYMARIKPEFDRRNVKVIGLSVDPVANHARWADDIRETQGHAPNYPMIGDSDLTISKLYGMLPAEHGRRLRRADAGRQPDRAQRLRRRAGQEDQAGPRLSDDDRPQLR